MQATLSAHLRLNSAQFSGGLNRAVRESSVAVGKISAQFASLKNIFTGGALGIGAGFLIGDMLGKAAEYEKYTRMLSLVSGGLNGAKLELAELRKEALKPGLDLESAVTATVRLRTLGYTTQQTREYMNALANKVAAFGGGGEEMKGVIIALSQIASKGKVSAEEINQIAERMPGIREDMKAAFGTANTEEIQKMGISARDFIDTILNRWKDAPAVVSGLSEEMKNFRNTMDSLKAYGGQIFAPMVAEVNNLVRGLTAVHQIVTMTLDEAAGGGLLRQMEAERFAGEMERKLADQSAIKKQEGEKVFGSTAEEMEKRAAAIKEYQARRDAAANAAKQMATSDEAELEIVRAQLEEITDIEETTKAITDAYATQQDIQKETLERQQRYNGLKREEKALVDAINRKEADRINDAVDERMKTPRQRKQEMRDKNERKRAAKREFRKEENAALKKEEDDARNNRLDNIKKGNFFDKDEARKRIRKEQAERWKNALQDSATSLKNIEKILGALATA